MQIRITFSLNTDAFLLLTEKSGYSIQIESCYLRVSYIEPHEVNRKENPNTASSLLCRQTGNHNKAYNKHR